jgi:hypothetical protein
MIENFIAKDKPSEQRHLWLSKPTKRIDYCMLSSIGY